MKKRYTKKQIREAIAYWQKQLKKLDEVALHKYEVRFSVGNNALPHVTAVYGRNEDEAWKEVLKHNPTAKKYRIEIMPNKDIDDELIDCVNEESTYGNSMLIDAISELIRTIKLTKNFNKADKDSYEYQVWCGEFDDIEKNLKTIEKNLRLLGAKKQDVEAEKEVYVNLVPIFRDIITSLLFIIRSRYGMDMSGWAGRVLNKSFDKFHARKDSGISNDITVYNKDSLIK